MSIIREYEGDDGNYIEIVEDDARVVFALDNGRNGQATLVNPAPHAARLAGSQPGGEARTPAQ